MFKSRSLGKYSLEISYWLQHEWAMFLLKYTGVYVITEYAQFCKIFTFWDRPFKTCGKHSTNKNKIDTARNNLDSSGKQLRVGEIASEDIQMHGSYRILRTGSCFYCNLLKIHLKVLLLSVQQLSWELFFFAAEGDRFDCYYYDFLCTGNPMYEPIQFPCYIVNILLNDLVD